MLYKLTVMLHGFVKLPDGSSEHCEDQTPEGWCVWVRRDFEADTEFDDLSYFERDLETEAAAWTYARELASQLECEIDDY